MSVAFATASAASCNPTSISPPALPGAAILDISADLVLNYTRSVSDQLFYGHPSIEVRGIDYCNVTVTYTHPGQNDTLNVETWLPLETWNGRLQAVGGGGYVAGRFPLSYTAMAGALGEGYVSSTTDGGIGSSYVPDPWALVSEGNVDLFALQNFASRSLNDQAIIAKDVIESFYGLPPQYSYWSGCSQGGRQGFMLAQRYPEAYDGIAANAPALNWNQFIPGTAWAQTLMHITGQFPYSCELDAITEAAVAECDPLDGVTDGLISDEDACGFDPFSVVNKTIACAETEMEIDISHGAAMIANSTWTGPRTTAGKFLWYGPGHQAGLSGSSHSNGITSDLGYAMTTCSKNGTCVGIPTGFGEEWLRLFVKKNSTWKYTNIQSIDEYAHLFHSSVQQFDSIIGTNDPDLSAFRDAGGKLLTYHGLADGIIPTKGTRDYFKRAVQATPDIDDYFRYFEVPGLAHCSGGSGGQPTATFKALVEWVEKGVVPKTIPITWESTKDNSTQERILCPYPLRAVLNRNGTESDRATHFHCAE
ncbi:hypothetical protein Q7P37_006697 [Cladosporium fusiforme]